MLVYLIARDYFEERAARLVSLAYAFFLFPATLVTVLCNNIPSAFFLYLCLYLVMGKGFKRCHRVLIYALAGASLAVANALRPDAPLVEEFPPLPKALWGPGAHLSGAFGGDVRPGEGHWD